MLQTRNVFIDTQCYVKAGLHFEGAAFKAFLELCKNNELKLLCTSIVKKEVENKIHDSIKESLIAISTFQRKAKILENIDDDLLKAFFKKIDPTLIHQLASREFETFLNSCNVEYASINQINVENVFEDYFSKKPPFGDGKKKNEFPDACSLHAIKNHIEDDGIYIVSEDNDLKNFCQENEGFFLLDSIDALLNIYNTHENHLSDAILRYVGDNVSILTGEIENILNGAEAYNISTWEDSELESHRVISITDLEPSIIFIEENTCLLTFIIDVDFEVHVSGPDYTNGYWDSEDKIMIPMETITRTDQEEKNFTVEMELNFEIQGEEVIVSDYSISIDKITSGIEFSIDEVPCHDYY